MLLRQGSRLCNRHYWRCWGMSTPSDRVVWPIPGSFLLQHHANIIGHIRRSRSGHMRYIPVSISPSSLCDSLMQEQAKAHRPQMGLSNVRCLKRF